MRSAALLVVGVVMGVAWAMNAPRQEPQAQAEPQVAAQSAAPGPRRMAPQSQAQVTLSYAPIVRSATPAVVNIYTKRVVKSPMMEDPFFRFFFGERGGAGRERVEQSLGSGVIVRSNGFVITNNHVINCTLGGD
jgi:S1-C subfamily serine protease